MAEPYVIIGNGVAGINAAEAIRARDPHTPILMLSDQECEFYSRPALYYVLLGRIEFADTAGRPKGFYHDNNIELRCSTKVAALDPANHTVTLDGGEEIRYGKVCLATGTVPRLLPWAQKEVQGMLTLNTLSDIVEISHAVGQAKEAVVVGGGLTSIELVESLVHAGVKTTFVIRDDRFLAKQLTSEEADIVHARMRRSGVILRTGDEVAEMTTKGSLIESVTMKNGDKIPCQLVGMAVGIVADTQLPRQAGLEIERGLVVDEGMHTNAPDVFAAGDCAQVRGADGRLRPGELLWYVAASMGEAAGANMAGGEEKYAHLPFLNCAEFYGTDFCGVGSIDPGQEGVTELWAQDTTAGTARVVLRQGEIVGGCFMGDIRLADITRELVAGGAQWEELDIRHPLRARIGD